MAGRMPIHLDLAGNNCTIFGGGCNTVRRAKEFLHFGAKVTVISPSVCPELQALMDSNDIRYIPASISVAIVLIHKSVWPPPMTRR